MTVWFTAKHAHHVMTVGVVVALASSIAGVARAFAADGRALQGMPMGEMPEMYLAGVGILLAVAGALLRGAPGDAAAVAVPGGRRRRLIAVVATTALTIDVSKTSTLGFVIPGMSAEYGLGPTGASMLAVAGLSGTALGAVVFSRLADRVGRRASYLIAALGFTATSLCASMPTFLGNVVMCFLMGIAVGGLAPLLITILTDLFPGNRRGSMVTALSVIATAVGYLVASGSALWLEPSHGWRVLWLIGAPTGLLLTAVAAVIPHRAPVDPRAVDDPPRRLARTTFTTRLQWLYAAMVGVLTFGLTAWVPSIARAGGLATTTANTLLTVVALTMVPCAVLVAIAYRRLGPIPLAVLMAAGTSTVLLVLSVSGLADSIAWLSAAALAVTLFAVNTMAAIFLPIAADLADHARRGRATGTVSLFNRVGGLTGPLALSFIVTSTTDVLTTVTVLALLCGAIAVGTGRRHRRLNGVAERAQSAASRDRELAGVTED